MRKRGGDRMKTILAVLMLAVSQALAGTLAVDIEKPFRSDGYLIDVLDVADVARVGAPLRRNDDGRPSHATSTSRTMGQTFEVDRDVALEAVVLRAFEAHAFHDAYPALWLALVEIDTGRVVFEDRFPLAGHGVAADAYLTLRFSHAPKLLQGTTYLMALWFDGDNDTTFLLCRTQVQPSTYKDGALYDSGQQERMNPADFPLVYPATTPADNKIRDLSFGLVGVAASPSRDAMPEKDDSTEAGTLGFVY